MQKLSKSLMNPNTARTLTIAALAVAQCLALSACGKRAMLVKPAPPTNNTGAGTGGPLTGTPPPAAADTGTKAGTPPGPAAIAPSKYDFAASITRVVFDINPNNGVVLSFNHDGPNGEELVNVTMTTTLAAAVAPTGAVLDTEPTDSDPSDSIKAYAGHLTCRDAACATALLVLSDNVNGAKANVEIARTPLSGSRIKPAGTPKDLQAKIAAALPETPIAGTTLHAMTAKVEKGGTYFMIDCAVPLNGATAAQKVTVSGLIGDKTIISLAYSNLSDSIKPESKEIAGSASIAKDGNIIIELNGDNDRIQSMTFGDIRTN